jgi:hypothetical protein
LDWGRTNAAVFQDGVLAGSWNLVVVVFFSPRCARMDIFHGIKAQRGIRDRLYCDREFGRYPDHSLPLAVITFFPSENDVVWRKIVRLRVRVGVEPRPPESKAYADCIHMELSSIATAIISIISKRYT